MGKINVLSFAVANLIAAGEVVDRPASVIKELVENSIDSGATRITVEIQNGGVTLMRVTDNGCGMERDDLPVAVRRHATSKIKDETDLNSIMTLGFRGEALAAIAAVSDLRIISKTEQAESGAMIEVSGGVMIGIVERASQNGTTVFVENLFSNVPARRKFLKKDITETMAVNAVVEKIALSHPEIAFRLITDGNTRLETVGDGSLKSAVYAVFGKEFTRALIEVNGESEGIRVEGFCGRTDNCKANRNFQNFFINRRFVKSRTAQAAIEQAYVSYIPQERFPVCILNIDINPSLVDVNVHPSKLEVKFSNEKPVFEAIYYSVRASLEQNKTRPEMKLDDSFGNSLRDLQNTEQNTHASIDLYPAVQGQRMSDRQFPIPNEREESLKHRQLEYDVTVKASESKKENINISNNTASDFENCEKTICNDDKTSDKPYVENQTPIIASDDEVSEWRIIGEAFNSYILVERGEKMIIIDKHAAHERLIFEKLKANMHNIETASQILMLPIEAMLRSDEVEMLEQYRKETEAIGFGYSTGKNTVSITELPDGIEPDAAIAVITEIAGQLLNNTGTPNIMRDTMFEKALYQASCKAAIKAGREYPEENRHALVEKLMSIPDITFCPHGRPVAMELTKKTLDRQFSRT